MNSDQTAGQSCVRNWRLVVGVLSSGLLIGLVFPLPAASQNQLDTVISGYISEAWARHPDIEAMRAMADAESSRTVMNRAWMNPELRAGIMNVPEDLKTNSDPMTMFQVGLMQRVPFPGKLRTAAKAREADTRASASAVEVGKFRMAAMIAMAYYDLSATVSMRPVLERGQHLADEMREAAALMYASGMESQAAVRRAQLEAEEWRIKSIDNEAEISRSRIQLAYALGREDPNTLSDPPILQGVPNALLFKPEDHDSSVRHSPVLVQSRFVRDAAFGDLQRAKLEYWPDLDLMLSFGFRRDLVTQGTDPHTGKAVSEKMKQDNMLSLEMSFPLPLLYRRNQRAAISEMASMYRRREDEVRTLELAKLQELRELAVQFERAREGHEILMESILPQAEAVWRSTMSDYRSGKVNFMQLAEARMNVVMNEMRVIMLRAEAWSLWAKYAFAAGRFPVNPGGSE